MARTDTRGVLTICGDCGFVCGEDEDFYSKTHVLRCKNAHN